MNTHLLGNEHQWIIETHYEDSEEFEYHWDKKVFPSETREDVSDQTSTYRGKQWNIHPQAFFIDLDWWASVGCPEWGVEHRYELPEPFETIEPIRSKENWHDEYTPHWIAPSKNLKNYSSKTIFLVTEKI